jgi:hypothetical protein
MKMEWMKDKFFRVYAQCATRYERLTRPIRVHIKFSCYPCCDVHTSQLVQDIVSTCGMDVTISKERSPFHEGNYEVFVVGGKGLLFSRRNGDGFVDSCDKRARLVTCIRQAVADAIPPPCWCCEGDQGVFCCKSLY